MSQRLTGPLSPILLKEWIPSASRRRPHSGSSACLTSAIRLLVVGSHPGNLCRLPCGPRCVPCRTGRDIPPVATGRRTARRRRATFVWGIPVPDGALHVEADAVGDAIVEVGPHSPVGETAVGRDVERREPVAEHRCVVVICYNGSSCR